MIMGGSMAVGELKVRLVCQESGSSGYAFLLLTHVALGKSLYCLGPTSPFELDTVYKVPVTSELCVYYLKNLYIHLNHFHMILFCHIAHRRIAADHTLIPFGICYIRCEQPCP